jgi:hypothetical protein
LKIFLILSLSSLLAASSCQQAPPKWDGKIWAADSASESIQRSQAHEAIACDDPVFDDYLCISGADFQRFYETYVLGCEKWRDDLPKMNATEMMVRLREMKKFVKVHRGVQPGQP